MTRKAAVRFVLAEELVPGTFNVPLMTSRLVCRLILKEPAESLHLVSAVVDYNSRALARVLE
jgi:hypothetical protein